MGLLSMPSRVILHKTGAAKPGLAAQVPDGAGGPWSMGRGCKAADGRFLECSPAHRRGRSNTGGGASAGLARCVSRRRGVLPHPGVAGLVKWLTVPGCMGRFAFYGEATGRHSLLSLITCPLPGQGALCFPRAPARLSCSGCVHELHRTAGGVCHHQYSGDVLVGQDCPQHRADQLGLCPAGVQLGGGPPALAGVWLAGIYGFVFARGPC